jgi:hypothetical protein
MEYILHAEVMLAHYLFDRHVFKYDINKRQKSHSETK